MKFQVYKSSETGEFKLCAAYMFGPDRVPLRGSRSIKFKDGTIECVRKNRESAGLALLWKVPGFGKLLLHTTRLPERSTPYILNVELARAKLMEITLKREDWSLFEETNSISAISDEAKELFIQALQNVNEPGKAAMLADKSLKKALEFSEKLTSKHAELLFEARLKTQGFSRRSLACRVKPERITEPEYTKKALDMFAHIAMEINWAKIESVKGQYNFDAIDRCIDIFGQKKVFLSAGPLLCFLPQYLPQWLIDSKSDFAKIREACYEFITKIVTRYSKYVHSWQVICGINAYNHFKFSFEQILEITRTANLAAREAESKSIKIIDIACPWGEYYALQPESIPPLVYVDMVTQSGISFDAFGIQMVFGADKPGMHIRDMMQLSAMLDRFAAVPKPLYITSVAVPDGADPADQQLAEFGGTWHRPWDQQLQAEWLESFCKIALSKPFVNSVTYANLTDDKDATIAGSGLLGGKLEPKKAFLAMAKLQKYILTKPQS